MLAARARSRRPRRPSRATPGTWTPSCRGSWTAAAPLTSQPSRGVRARRLRPANALPPLGRRPADPLRGPDRAARRAVRQRRAAAALGPPADGRPSRPRARRLRRRRSRQHRVPAGAARRASDRRRRGALRARSRAGCHRRASPRGQVVDALLEPRRRSATRSSTTRSTSSSRTSRTPRAACATSPPSGTSGALEPGAFEIESPQGARARCETPKSSCCASARCSTSRAAATPTCSPTSCRNAWPTRWAATATTARQPRRSADGHVLPPRAGRSRARAGTRAARGQAVGRRRPCSAWSDVSSRLRATASGFVDPARRRPDRRVARDLPSRDGARVRASRSRPSTASSRTSAATRPTTSSAPRRSASSSAASSTLGPGLYARLSEMHDCGLLEQIFPEFERIHGRVVRDFYHRYTVDEHTLLTIRGLECLWHPATPSRKRFGSLLQELRCAGAADAGAALPRRRQGRGHQSRAGERRGSRAPRSIGSSCRRMRARPSSS